VPHPAAARAALSGSRARWPRAASARAAARHAHHCIEAVTAGPAQAPRTPPAARACQPGRSPRTQGTAGQGALARHAHDQATTCTGTGGCSLQCCLQTTGKCVGGCRHHHCQRLGSNRVLWCRADEKGRRTCPPDSRTPRSPTCRSTACPQRAQRAPACRARVRPGQRALCSHSLAFPHLSVPLRMVYQFCPFKHGHVSCTMVSQHDIQHLWASHAMGRPAGARGAGRARRTCVW